MTLLRRLQLIVYLFTYFLWIFIKLISSNYTNFHVKFLSPLVQVEVEVKRLKHLKASKMKELVLKKMTQLEEIYRSVHMHIDSDHEWQILTELIDSGSLLSHAFHPEDT